MMNLKQIDHHEDSGLTIGESEEITNPAFAAPSTFLGNIGEALDHSQSDGDIDYNDEHVVKESTVLPEQGS